MPDALSEIRRPLRAVVLLAAALAAALALSLALQAPTALAATKYVCADTLTLRHDPNGAYKATLYRNAVFDTITTQGAWTRGNTCWPTSQGGTACGSGWVLNQYLSSSPC